jgi:FlaA1/EpsC-like NDP-sugar epimerase
LIALGAARQFGSILTYFGVSDLLKIIAAMTACTALLIVAHLFSSHLFTLPRGALVVDFLLSLGGICSARLGIRVFREKMSSSRGSRHEARQRIAIVGAGDAGASLANEFINLPRRGFKPVAFFDDDPKKHGWLVHGVPVVGRPDEIGRVRKQLGIGKVVIAMPSAPAKRVREIVQLLGHAGLNVETMPSIEELASGRAKASRIRPVEIQDLLGREPVNLDSDGIRKLVEGRVVMVTGAGGSIGSELCRQVAALNPQRLLMVERAEGNLFIIEQELNETGLGAIALPLVADILDEGRMEFIFARHKPDVVFHAAAHKHVYMMERQPSVAFRNNVIGTRTIARQASENKVGTFVLISTDKAVNPTSVMGATKRLAEIQIQAVQAMQKEGGTRFIAVRFGNVLGSSGSVIPIFKRQIENGGPVTVTHPEVTRYFMTVTEAVGLVLQSAVLGKGGEIFVLDMKQQVKILDLARQMIELSGFKPGEDIEIKFTGLKPGEKLFEELQHHAEQYEPTDHPRIMRFVSQVAFSESGVEELGRELDGLEPGELKERLQVMVPEYTPHLE